MSLFKRITDFINLRPIFFLLLVTIIVYFKSLFNGYALDDELYALNPSLTELTWKQFVKIFSSATFNDKGAIGYDYRPVALSSFFIEYLVFGKHVLVSHTINLVIYLVVLIQFYKILIRLGADKGIVIATMLLFALHPVHSEVICNLKCRDELLAFVFALLSFHFAISYFQKPGLMYLLVLFLSFFVSLLSKQTTVAFLIAVPISLALCFDFNKKKILVLFLMLLASVIIFMLIRKQVIPVNMRKYVYYENPFAIGRFFLLKSATGLDIALRYLGLLLVPEPLAYYYGYRYVDISSFRDAAVIASVFIHFALIIVFVKNLKTNKYMALGLFFYLLNIFISTLFLHKIPGLMGERYLFFASLGYCIVLSLLLQRLLSFFKTKKAFGLNVAVVGILIIYAILSFNRSKVWKDKETLYSNDMKTLENSAKANLLYGSLLSEQALRERDKTKMEKAIYHLQKTTLIVPDYSLAWENLGVLYYFTGDIKNALSSLNRAILKDSSSGKAYFDKAVIYESMKYPATAEKLYITSLKKDPAYIPGYLKLMNLLEKQSHIDKALRIGSIGAAQEKKSDLIYSEMIRIALSNKDTVNAILFSEKAVVINPKNISRIQTLENYFRSKGDLNKAGFYQALLKKEKQWPDN